MNRIIYSTLILLSCHLIADPIRDFWFNGAEINHYELDQSRYGMQHPGHAELIFVTEPFNTQKQVKSDFANAATAPALKLNALRTFNTGVYSYRTMLSTFTQIDSRNGPQTLKTTFTEQDWCGQVFQQMNRTKSGWRGELRSYFESEGDQDFQIKSAWLEDELFVILRLDPQRLPIGTVHIVPSALSTRFAHQPIQIAQAEGNLSPAKDPKQMEYRLKYPKLKRELCIHFDKAFPHIIRQWQEIDPAGTTTAVLTHRIMNSTYWSQNRPEDRELRKELGLNPEPQ